MEASPKPNLRLIDTGEVPSDAPSYSEALRLIEIKERKIRGYELLLQQKDREIAGLQEAEPESEDVRSLLIGWADLGVMTKFWTRRPVFKPGDSRWKPTKAALNKHDRPYLRMVIIGAFDDAVRQRKAFQQRTRKMPFNRRWLEPATIFGTQVHRLYEHAADPEDKYSTARLDAPIALRDRWQQILDLGDRCDCGHARIDHDRPSLVTTTGFDWGECRVHGCHCTEWDDFHTRVDGWLAERAPRPRFRT